ncbi:MAG: hypothetical protein M1281_11920 [Chloroflexi bacterium]|nr:hypothetical protein [Chloroflexota bacterium]
MVGDDHRFYKKHGLFDFLQKDIGKQLFNMGMGIAFVFKLLRIQASDRMTEMYIQQRKQIVKSGKPVQL